MMTVSLPPEGNVFVITGENGTGKTRWLAQYSRTFLQNEDSGRLRLVCLSGSVTDKFPLDNEIAEGALDRYAYFGRRTNNNMFSEIAPFRKLVDYISTTGHGGKSKKERGQIASEMLKNIGLGPVLKLAFRRGRNSKERLKVVSNESLNLSVSLDRFDNDDLIKDRAVQIAEGLLHVTGITFRKNERDCDLMNLSSGERSYALTILALAFSTTDGCTVLFDEPENSLHPQWQARVMQDMSSIVEQVSKGSKLVVATHSPLIVSGAENRSTYILNMPSDGPWVHSTLYGGAADVVLKRQFGLLSPRSMSFIRAVQECVEALINKQSEPARFRSTATSLLQLGVVMDVDDPLYGTVSDIRAELEAMG